MTVPLSDAVASIVPVEFIARKEMGDLCACKTLTTESDRVSNRRTSPECGESVAVLLDGCGVESGDVGEGTGDGYAKYEGSDEEESAQIASGFLLVSMTCCSLMLLMS